VILLLFVFMFALMFLGMEIFISIGVATMAYLLIFTDTPVTLVATSMIKGIDNYSLLAIPFFILAGELMNISGMTLRLVELSKYFIGKLRGGLAYSTVMLNLFASGISGSAPADCSAVSSVMLPAMRKEGYKPEFSAALNAASSVLGPIIPPSIPLVFLALMTNISVGKLFLGGIIPGLLIGFALMFTAYLLMRKQNMPVMTVDWTMSGFRKSVTGSIWALIAPLVVIFGVITGFVTLTEVAILISAYVLIIGMFVYKTIKVTQLFKVFRTTAVFSATILMLFCVVDIFTYIMASEGVGELMKEWVTALGLGAVGFLLIVNIFFLLVGMPMDALPAMLIFVPVLLPIAMDLGIDPVHFGVVITVNLMIGLVTPPVGSLLNIVSKIGRVPFNRVSVAVTPFTLSMIAVLFLITYVPFLVTWIPNWLMG